MSSSASAGCTTVVTALSTSPQSHWKVLPSTASAVCTAPPTMGANAWDKLLTTPGRNTVARYWASGASAPCHKASAAVRSGPHTAAAAARICAQAACQAAMAGA